MPIYLLLLTCYADDTLPALPLPSSINLCEGWSLYPIRRQTSTYSTSHGRVSTQVPQIMFSFWDRFHRRLSIPLKSSWSWCLCFGSCSIWACTPLLCWSHWSPISPSSLHPYHLALPGATRIHPLQASWHVSTHVTDTGQAGHVPQPHPHAVHAVEVLPW